MEPILPVEDTSEPAADATPSVTREEYFRRRELITAAFSPATPITTRDLFAGRQQQMVDLIDVLGQRGQHAVIFGERGVGKTSLANVIVDVTRGRRVFAGLYTCSGSDSFGSVWGNFLREIPIIQAASTGVGFRPVPTEVLGPAADLLGDDPGPDDVRRAFTVLSREGPMAVFIDEFDTLSPDAHALFADTVKVLSDHAVNVTVVFVGVADSVEGLISEHHSIERSLVQVQMPRMSFRELAEIVVEGVKHAEMTISDEVVVSRIARMSQGLPHYTHLFSLNAARAALDDRRTTLTPDDVDAAIRRARELAAGSIQAAYRRATTSNRETLYKEVLLACALARVDEVGTFAATDVREKMLEVTGKKYDIPAFSQHLTDFSSDGARGGILQKTGTTRRFRYRFVNPLLKPFVLMQGVSEGLVDIDALGWW